MYVGVNCKLCLTPTSQMEVRCPRDPGVAIAITPPKRQNTRLACPNPQPSHEPPVRPPTPSTRHTQAQMAHWKENYTISPRENDSETGEGGKGTLRTLLQTKHTTPIKQQTKAHGMDTRVPDENTAGRKTAPALQQPNESQKRYKHTPQR